MLDFLTLFSTQEVQQEKLLKFVILLAQGYLKVKEIMHKNFGQNVTDM